MTKRKLLAVVGVVCGLELVAVAVIGGAGVAAVFGLEGFIVALAVVLFVALTVVNRRNRTKEAPMSEQDEDTAIPDPPQPAERTST